jgi:DNA-binding response OmpR family regulator
VRVLIAEDDATSRRLLELTLNRWGNEAVTAADGNEAWEWLQRDDCPRLAILDWMMPGIDGTELCRRVRERLNDPPYVILLTARGTRDDMVEGLDAGADDYVTKPFDREELRARVRAGQRILELQDRLKERVRELEEAIAHVRLLQGILPICCYCKKVRDDQNYWQQVESYIARHSDMQFSHGICPDCWESKVKPELELIKPK